MKFTQLSRSKSMFTVTGYIVASIYALIVLIPLYYIFVSAFKSNSEIFGSALSFPESFSLVNFFKAEKTADLTSAMLTSLLVTTLSELVALLLGFPAAYAIARIRTKLTKWVAGFFSIGFLIPAFAMMVPVLVMVSKMGLLYSPLALVVFYPAWRLPFTVIVMVSYLKTVPRELEESAEIDGASRFSMLWHIFFPLTTPGLITVVILNFISIWNEFLFALILLSQKSRTIQVAISLLKSERLVDYGMLTAGVLFSIVPILIVFFIFQRRIIGGTYVGAVKG